MSVAAPPRLPAARALAPGVVGARERAGDRRFRRIVLLFGLGIVAVAAGIFLQLAWNSRLAWAEFGFGFLAGDVWNPVEDVYGAWPFIFGTLYSSFLALLIAVPVGVGSAIFLAELAPKPVSAACTFLIELLAAIPSVVLGLMGVFLLVPAVRAVEPWLNTHLGAWLPLFRGAPYGVGMLAAASILSLMILPYITTISRDVLLAVPQPLKEAVLALGATRWEMVRTVSLPYAKSGIIGAVFLALGRALGETMAVTMVIGNMPQVSWSLLDPGYSMASVIANEFAEATSDMQLHALIAVGLSLFVITILVNAGARLLVYRSERLKG